MSYNVAVSFIGGGNQSTRRKLPTCRKSLTNFITYCCIEYTSPWTWLELTTLVMIGIYCTGSCKSNNDHDHDGHISWIEYCTSLSITGLCCVFGKDELQSWNYMYVLYPQSIFRKQFSPQKFYCRHHDLVNRYAVFVSHMTTDMFRMS
jgi:hypothetical protein